MVPVRRGGVPATIPANAGNRFGYDLEFDNEGRLGDLRIDFEAIAEHLFQLHAAAKQHGIGIRRVIFEVPLQRHLWNTKRGRWLRANISFSTRPAWVRHDEHYHIDFELPCKPMR
jgi:penicillin-insensitive murein endopeptidase